MLDWLRARRPARSPSGPIALREGQVHHLHLKPGDALLVRQGRVWMTRDGDLLDHLLAPGQGHVAARREDVVLQGCSAGGCVYQREPFSASGRG
jgi:hypothetical protein